MNGRVVWANLHLLFWLSLFRLFTGWMGENHFAAFPSTCSGGVLLMAAIAYYILQNRNPQTPPTRYEAGQGHQDRHRKGKLSPSSTAITIGVSSSVHGSRAAFTFSSR